MNRNVCRHIVHSFCIRYREESKLTIIIHFFCHAKLSGTCIENRSCTTEEQVTCGCEVYACKSRLKISFCSKISKKIYCIFRRLVFTKGICSCLISLDKFRTCYSPWREGKISHKLPCIGSSYNYRNLTHICDFLAILFKLFPGRWCFSNSSIFKDVFSVHKKLTIQCLWEQIQISIICISKEITNCSV